MNVSSTYFLGILVVSCGSLTASQRQMMLTESVDYISERLDPGYPHDYRMRRSLINISISAAKALLDGAKFLYSNGFDSVYVKRGGIKKALKDFDSVVDSQNVKFLRTSENTVKKVGRVGGITITVTNESGKTVMTLAKKRSIHIMGNTDPRSVDSIIVYRGH